MIEQTKIPEEELGWFQRLKDVGVVFDVGARTDIDYVRLKPDIVLHAFEPDPEFFEGLKEQIGNKKGVFLNNYALGDKEEEKWYSRGLQGIVDYKSDYKVRVKTLDKYIEENKIERIDFLKIDTESYDYKVLMGGTKVFQMAKYIQYEYGGDGNEREKLHDLFDDNWVKIYYGYRNVLCVKKPYNL